MCCALAASACACWRWRSARWSIAWRQSPAPSCRPAQPFAGVVQHLPDLLRGSSAATPARGHDGELQSQAARGEVAHGYGAVPVAGLGVFGGGVLPPFRTICPCAVSSPRAPGRRGRRAGHQKDEGAAGLGHVALGLGAKPALEQGRPVFALVGQFTPRAPARRRCRAGRACPAWGAR